MTGRHRHRALRAAVIGCGAISAEHLTYLGSAPDVELVGVCDASAVSARFAQERYGATAAYTDATTMLAEATPEVVHVLTPPHTHVALAELCLAAGTHVVCEKPMTATAADTSALLDRAAAAGRILVESRNLLWNDPVMAIDRLVADGRLGEIREVDVLMSLDLTGGRFGDVNLSGPGVVLPGGAVHDFLPHLAYLFLHFAGTGDATPALGRVAGVLANASGNPRVGYDRLDALVEGGGCRGRLRVASDVKPDVFRLAVRGTKGSVETDLYNPFLRIEGGANVGKRSPIEQVLSGTRLAVAGFTNFRDKVLQHGTYHGMPRMLDAVYTAIATGAPSPITPAQLRATAELVDRLVALGEPATGATS